MAASKLLQKHLFLGQVAYNSYYRPTMTPFLLSFFFFLKMKIKKISLRKGHLITSESPTTSAKALNAEHFEQTKSAVSKGNVFNV